MLSIQQKGWWALVTGHGPISNAADEYRGTPIFPAEEGLRLYRSMYRTRLGQVLLGTFPNLASHLGSEAFRDLAMTYLDDNPSTDPRIEYVGRRMEAYLRQQAQADLRELANLAALDWARQAALLAPNPTVIAALSSCDPAAFSTARLEFIPSLSLVMTEREHGYAIWSDLHHLLERALETDESAALSSALQGNPMAIVCGAFSTDEDPIRRAFCVLRAWSMRQWIARIVPMEGGAP